MKNSDFTTTILVDKSPEEAYDAINDVRGWWSGDIEGVTDKLNEVFTYRYKNFHFTKHKITELVPGKKVVWLILESYLSFVEDKKEWDGTQIVFDISEKDGKTTVRFTHKGLVPRYECFDACSNAWTDYVQNSLKHLIETGKGKPNKKEKKEKAVEK